MAQHKSAKKRARQNLKRRARNRHVTSGIKSAVKSLRSAEAKDVPAAMRHGEGTIRRSAEAKDVPAAMRHAEGTIRRAASKGVGQIHAFRAGVETDALE